MAAKRAGLRPPTKGFSRCTECGQRGHNARNPLCPENVARAAAALVLRTWAVEVDAEIAQAKRQDAAADLDPVALMLAAARSAAVKVAS